MNDSSTSFANQEDGHWKKAFRCLDRTEDLPDDVLGCKEGLAFSTFSGMAFKFGCVSNLGKLQQELEEKCFQKRPLKRKALEHFFSEGHFLLPL